MWIKEPGAVTERIEFLGSKEICSYLLKGDVYALIGGGMAHVVPKVLAQLEDLDIDLERIRHLIILHTHYDHLGMAPYLARQWPWLRVAVSRVGSQVLKNQRALKTIQDYNNSALGNESQAKHMVPLNLIEEGFPVHDLINGGMELSLGDGVKLRVIETPGHSVCSMTIYFPGEHTLFPSDGIGAFTEERLLPMGSSNFDDFQDSIEKLCEIDAEIFCFEHYGVLTPPEAKGFCGRAKREAQVFREKMRDIYCTHKDVEQTVEELSKECYTGLSKIGVLPEVLLKDLLRRMVRFVNQVG
jgi:glyoxylase-like metal-dependent hydrolase (beta-lactamase superfamily II)